MSRGLVDAIMDATVTGDSSFEGIYEATALDIVRNDDAGIPCGLIEAETEPIRTWVADTFEGYQRNSTQLTADSL